MTAHHPWGKFSHEKIGGRLDAVSLDAEALWWCTFRHMCRTGADGVIERRYLALATARRLSPQKIAPLVDELLAEGLVELDGELVRLVPWEQPPVETWSDPVLRQRWTRKRQLNTMSDLKERVRTRDRHLCRYCGVRVNWADHRGPKGGTFDHVDPDGDNTLDNLVVACRRCNGKKRDRTPEQALMSLWRPGSTMEDISTGRARLASAAHAASALSPEQTGRSAHDPPSQGPGSDPGRTQVEPESRIGFTSRARARRADPSRTWVEPGSERTAIGGADVAPPLTDEELLSLESSIEGGW